MKPLCRTLALVAAILLITQACALAQDNSINLRRTTTVQVVNKTKDAVVSIVSSVTVAQRVNPFGNDPFFRNFDFGTQFVPGDSLGSGFVVHKDGYIITNNHVVERASKISVKFADGRSFDADLLSSDAAADLAILKINAPTPLVALELGDSSDLMIGEPVIAVGNPLGYSHSVSTGIVSAVHRDIHAGEGGNELGDLIQTDAAINPGNSGGPLLNAYGQVIGINTAIRGDAQNIGFAIQVNRLRDLIPELMSPAQISKLDMPIKLKEKRALTPPSNVFATVFRADDGAAVQSIAGTKPVDIVDAYAILLKQAKGKSFEIALEGKPKLKIEPREVAPPDSLVKARERLGLGLDELTPMMAGRMNLQVQDGMYVREVLRNGPAAKVGIQPGDVIISLGRYQVHNLKDFDAGMQIVPDSGRVRVGIRRGPALGYAVIEL